MRALGLSTQKTAYIATRPAYRDGQVVFEELEGLSDEEGIDTAPMVKGIGVWTGAHVPNFPLRAYTYCRR